MPELTDACPLCGEYARGDHKCGFDVPAVDRDELAREIPRHVLTYKHNDYGTISCCSCGGWEFGRTTFNEHLADARPGRVRARGGWQVSIYADHGYCQLCGATFFGMHICPARVQPVSATSTVPSANPALDAMFTRATRAEGRVADLEAGIRSRINGWSTGADRAADLGEFGRAASYGPFIDSLRALVGDTREDDRCVCDTAAAVGEPEPRAYTANGHRSDCPAARSRLPADTDTRS